MDTIVGRTRKYLKHNLKTREILSMLVDRTNFKDEKGFSELMPKYDVSINDIKEYIVEKIKEMNGTNDKCSRDTRIRLIGLIFTYFLFF